MVVGPTGGGKSVIINTLAHALEMGDGIKTQRDTLNAKSITLKELYGVLDPDSRDWTDGLLSKTYRNANQPPLPDDDEKRNWLLFDGDVDAIWIENMNSVMDDNRILTLDNGDRLKLQKHCILMFEVFDLQYASPATISRCGMVFVDPKNLGYQPFYQRWWEKKKIQYGETFADNLKELYAKYFPIVMDRIFEGYTGEEDLAEPLKFITPRTNMNLIEQLTILIDSLLPDDPEQAPQDFSNVEKLFLFCIIWSCGGALVEEDRQTFDVFLHQNAATLLPNNLYDNVWDPKINRLDLWQNRVSQYTGSPDGQYASILVPTMDTTRYAWLLNSIVALKKPVLFCGSSGASKTVTAMAAFKQLSMDEYIFLNINFSSRTTSLDFQSIINENIDRKSGSIYGPKTPGKRLIVFIDDMNMPTIDRYGTQQPNALLKFMVARNQLFERKGDLNLLDLVGMQYIGCTTPPAGGNNRVDPRLMSLYSVFNIT
jgi:dynein heavy chain, axonemal